MPTLLAGRDACRYTSDVKRSFVIVVEAFSLVANLQAQRCTVCNLPVSGTAYLMTDRVTEEERVVCDQCAVLSTRCFLCGLPVKDDLTQLGDGRVLCARDSKGVVLSEEEAKRVCDETRNELDRVFSRFMAFPATNVAITLADKVHMEQLFQTPGFERQCPSIFGYIKSRPDEQGNTRHTVSLLSGLPKARLMAVCAHEMSHAWLNENLPEDRQLSADAAEGFCELVAFRLMAHLGQEQEQKVIKKNRYTRGQIDLFLEADRQFGFYTVLQWMKSGLDARMAETDLDRVRQTKFKPSIPIEVTYFPPQETMPVPDVLTLFGISGIGPRRLVLINDRALVAGESGKVRVGKSNVVVRCLEIRDNSVLIEIGGSSDKQELLLRPK